MSKTIWIVNEYNLPGVSRTRQTVLSQLLEEKGYTVYLICGSTVHKTGNDALKKTEKVRKEESDGATYYMVHTSNYHKSYERIAVALQFQKRVWRYRKLIPVPDVIVSDFAGLFGNGFLKWKKRYGTKVIFDILDLWPEGFIDLGYIKKESLISKILYRMEHKSYREADGLIFSMQGGRDYIIEKGWSKEVGGDVDTSNIGYLNNGIDLETVDKQKNDYIIDDTDLDSEKFKVVYLGSISSTNGLDVLVETARVLQERDANNILILIYGFGNQEKILKRMVSDYGLNNIKFKGKLDKKYGMNLLTRSDLTIFTFKNSPLWKYGISPNKLFMYFASGKPVLSMIKPAYDLVEKHKAGISVNNNPKDVADAIQRFAAMNPSEYEEYCRNSRKVADMYDYKNLVQVLIDKIEE